MNLETVDLKGDTNEKRTIVLPASHSAQPGDSMVLTASLRGCLLLYKMQDWIPVRERLLQDLIRNDAAYKTVRDELRSVIGHAEELIVASDRRVTLSMPLIEAAGLGDSALWVPQANHIGIWNPENYGAWIETVDGSENAKGE